MGERHIVAVLLTVALEIAGIGAYDGVFNKYQYSSAIPIEFRDNWKQEDLGSFESDIFASGKASWYDATKNNAWYTRASEWGQPVEFYAAAGPGLRRLVSLEMGEKISWGVATWRNFAKNGKRPKFIVTSISTGKSIVVTVTDWCGCYSGTVKDKSDDKIVDLSPSAFSALGVPLSYGVVDVIIEPVR